MTHRIWIVLACLLVPLGGNAQQARNCSAAGDQMSATECAAEGYRAADAELNRIWRLVKSGADQRGKGQALLAAQRAWLAYRDAHCDFERDQFLGGSIAGQVFYSCLDRLTRQRNAVLQGLGS